MYLQPLFSKRLSDSNTWLGDGTFKVSPALFSQIYSIHGVIRDSVIPLVYAMLPDKTVLTYHQLFEVQ